jgi:sugar/nucleoside kinase (ribokinase family)
MVRREGLLASADPQMSATSSWARPFKGILEHLDLLLLDEEEARKISGKTRISHAIEVLLREGPRVVAVKLGPRGCLVGHEGRIRIVGAYRVKPISTIGAGDAFDAAFVFGTLRKWSVEKTARFANVVGAVSTTRYGCMTAISHANTFEKIARRYYAHD